MPRVISITVLLLTLIVGTASLSVWLRNEIIRIGYETEAFQQKKKQLLQHQKELIVQIEQLRSLERIEEIALRKLGMKQPDADQQVYIAAKGMKHGRPKQHSRNVTLSKQRPER